MEGMDEKSDGATPSNKPILHVLVVGFHHKKGCQVEYSYPPLVEGSDDPTECPLGWKYLPTLALPDGSHNYDKDTVFFNLPSLTDRNQTIFGISCFRQIPVEKLINKTDDITRSTVQKSVCVLSRVPLYGHIQVKMELITHAYFDEGDFTKVSILEDTYHNLNDCIEQIEDLPTASQLYVGLSSRDLVLRLKHKALLLYKMLLLERRVLFFHSPVEPLCTYLLTLLSLHPSMLANGLNKSACFRASRPMSPVPEFSETPQESFVENGKSNSVSPSSNGESPPRNDESWGGAGGTSNHSTGHNSHSGTISAGLISREESSADLASSAAAAPDSSISNLLAELAMMDATRCGLPLQIFTQSYLCLPYLSLPYMDMLTDKNVRGYILGATNVLFKQKKNISDVIIEIETGKIETTDPELKRALHLTTEDLRFADYLVREVSGVTNTRDSFLEGVGYQGSDDWLRGQFQAYTLALLRTSLLPEGSKEIDSFNKWFMAAWQSTVSYKVWHSSHNEGHINDIVPGHPFAGQLSVADMKLRLAHTMQTMESGRKLNQAMVAGGRAVASTGRAVGGALSQAKGALSTWWSSLSTSSPQTQTGSASSARNGDDCDTNTETQIETALEVTEPSSLHPSPPMSNQQPQILKV